MASSTYSDLDETLIAYGTPRQQEIARAVVEHGSPAAAAEALGVSKSTIRDGVYNLRRRAADLQAAEARKERIESDFARLRPEDFDVSVANDGKLDKRYTQEKRQEYSRAMGDYANSLRGAALNSSHGGDMLGDMPPESAEYIVKLSEQERRFINRKEARAISLADAQEVLALRRFKRAAHEYLHDRITPTGYALRQSRKKRNRTVCLLLSDLHLGADLSPLDEPVPYRSLQESRRLEYVLRETLDYKPQHRERSELLLLLNGDMVEGQLMHDFRGGLALTEQKVIFWRYFRNFIGYCAQQFPHVRVVCQPGNHGRDKVRHPGRATSRKWDGHEWEMYWALSEMAAGLKNVTWQLDFRAVSVVDLYGSKLGLTHGDTEVKLGDPDKKAKDNKHAFDQINSTMVYGCRFDAWAIGHFHSPRYQPRDPRVIYNGALVPPNGYARTSGYLGEPCGQFLWESVEGYPVGDVRFLEVGERQDQDEKLGTLIEPFRFSAEAA